MPIGPKPPTPDHAFDGANSAIGEIDGVDTVDTQIAAVAALVRHVTSERRRGRGARSNESGRFEKLSRVACDDGWESSAELPPFRTTIQTETARRIITTNQSPDLSFDQSINPYRGCEHGCSYCYARPSHAYMGLSPGLDFESQLFVKTNAAELLERELSNPRYQVKTIALGTNTDPYQPIERKYRITRRILEVLEATGHPVSIVTKSATILRDIDILSRLARRRLVTVSLSVTTLDAATARKTEPRASTPTRRIEAVRELNRAGVPTGVLVAPIIPFINDHEIEDILESVHEAGAREAGYVLLRLPLELKDLFREWLETEYPGRAGRVINVLKSMRGGKDYDARWFTRQRGTGPYAEQIALRFKLALKRLGLNQRRSTQTTEHFKPPVLPGGQLRLL